MKLRNFAFVLGASVVTLVSVQAGAITISDASNAFTVGIGPNGELFDSAAFIGFRRNSDGGDFISPGTPRDAWGITSTAGSAYADSQFGGTAGITGTTVTSTANAATYTTLTSVGFKVVQNYSFVTPNILAIQSVVTNTSGGSLSAIFRRTVDLDIFPTEFNENTFGPVGSSPMVVASSYFGFESADPAVAYGSSCFAGCNATGDLGEGIDISLGTLGAGGSASFVYYYGINQTGQTLAQLFAQGQSVGVDYLIGSQSVENGVYPNTGANSAFLGFGDVAITGVPEPTSWAMLIAGFGLVGAAMRRRVALTA
jgi:hypothetical protein